MLDPDGTELPELNTARREALLDLREMIADRLYGAGLMELPQIEIAHQAGQSLATIQLKDALGVPQ